MFALYIPKIWKMNFIMSNSSSSLEKQKFSALWSPKSRTNH